jgi:hypothetical protein
MKIRQLCHQNFWSNWSKKKWTFSKNKKQLTKAKLKGFFNKKFKGRQVSKSRIT